MIYFFFVLGGHYPLFFEVDADEKEKCLRLFLLSNILLFRYQMILVLKIIASCYEKFTPDCFVILNVWYNIACDLRDFHK